VTKIIYIIAHNPAYKATKKNNNNRTNNNTTTENTTNNNTKTTEIQDLITIRLMGRAIAVEDVRCDRELGAIDSFE
jgi:hypothetical protein